ncbi:MAG: 3-ketoacyl-ACP reductase [Spirochaetales bacterium]|nr:MAG: 3-ketoacyl-ACP reductase [Spirochaetales bacterium]
MTGKVALVTGAGRGIGRGIAGALAGRGWTIAVNYRSDRGSAEACLESVKKAGGDGFLVQADVADTGNHERLVGEVMERTGRIDLLVNNAGMAPRQRRDILQLTPESFDEVMNVNLRGPVFLTRLVAGVMIEQVKNNNEEAPLIINITSISAVYASVNRAEYCMSKAALSMMTKLWAVRLAEYGIRVYEIRPGIIATDMTAGVSEKYDKLLEGGIALTPRWGKPEDVGKAVAALSENSFPYSTGAVFTVDGGLSVARL